VSAEESLQRAEELLTKLDETRAELEVLDEDDDPDKAIDILARLSEIAKEVEAELARAKREAEADADA
jgi:poly(A) polymerase Pap1